MRQEYLCQQCGRVSTVDHKDTEPTCCGGFMMFTGQPMITEHCKTIIELGECMRVHGKDEYTVSEETAKRLNLKVKLELRKYEESE